MLKTLKENIKHLGFNIDRLCSVNVTLCSTNVFFYINPTDFFNAHFNCYNKMERMQKNSI